MYQVTPPVAKIEDGYLSDHKMCTLEVRIGKISIGKSFWKFNNTLLLDDDFISKARDATVDIIRVNDIDNISRVLLLQTVLCVLRGWIISSSSAKKRELGRRLRELDENINTLSAEETEANNVLLSELRAERDQYVGEITRGNMLKCRANWRQYGEKGTKYFQGLVKRNMYRTVFESMELRHTKPGKKTADNNEML